MKARCKPNIMKPNLMRPGSEKIRIPNVLPCFAAFGKTMTPNMEENLESLETKTQVPKAKGQVHLGTYA